MIYRVRYKSYSGEQKGAYKNIYNAIKQAIKLGDGWNVYNEEGELIYEHKVDSLYQKDFESIINHGIDIFNNNFEEKITRGEVLYLISSVLDLIDKIDNNDIIEENKNDDSEINSPEDDNDNINEDENEDNEDNKNDEDDKECPHQDLEDDKEDFDQDIEYNKENLEPEVPYSIVKNGDFTILKIHKEFLDKAIVIEGNNTKEKVSSMANRLNVDFAINGSFFWTGAEVNWKNMAINTLVSNYKLINYSMDFSKTGICVRNDNNVTFEAYNQNSRIQHFIGGSPVLIRDGEKNIDHSVDGGSSNHPRSVIGLDEHYLYLITVDGRYPGTKGITIDKLADKLLEIGLTDAINLDGGGSSILYSKQKGKLNKNGSNSERLIPDCFGVTIK